MGMWFYCFFSLLCLVSLFPFFILFFFLFTKGAGDRRDGAISFLLVSEVR